MPWAALRRGARAPSFFCGLLVPESGGEVGGRRLPTASPSLSSQRGPRGHFKMQLLLLRGLFLPFSPQIPGAASEWWLEHVGPYGLVQMLSLVWLTLC